MAAEADASRTKLQRLEILTQELLAQRRLIIASNRGPIEYRVEADGSLVAQRGSGGMVTALLGAARFVPAIWVASAMTEGDRLASQRAGGQLPQIPENEIYVKFVTVPQSVYQRHYYVFCNPLLWFVQHFMWNTPRTPNIGRAVYEAWDSGYIPVNQAIAQAIIDEARHHPEPPFVLLQDYHLYLAPAMVRQGAPDATILHFTHIPWPGPRYWGILPEFMRRRIHEDMCSADIVGLQTRADTQNFLHSCDAMLAGAQVDYLRCTIKFRGRTTHVRTYPISVDAPGLLEFSESAEVQQYRDRLKPFLGSEQTIVRVDRSEPSKNIIRGLRAWELLLERYPEFRGKVSFLQFLVPSRSELGVYQTYTDEIFELVESINDHFGDLNWQPIRVFYEENYPQAIAGMTLYDVLLVNPIIDGMNLVSKEGPLVNTSGVLILSDMAGSYEQLSEYVLPIAPTDLEGTVRALYQALTMPAEERRRRAAALRRLVLEEDITYWLERQFRDLMSLSKGVL